MSAEDLLHILDDLRPDEFERFKWYLKNGNVGNIPPIQESRLSNAERWNVVDLMVQTYKLAGAVEVTKNVLKKISRNNLLEKLPTITSGAEDQEKVLQRRFPGVVEDEFSRGIVQIQGGVNFISFQGPVMVVPLAIEHFKNLHPQRDEVQKNISDKNRQAKGADEKLVDYRTTQDTFMKTWNTLSLFFTDNKKRLKENHSDIKVNLVLLGMSGSGKSLSGNTILGERQFESKASYMPITTECQAAETVIHGTHVRVIDTPDMFDDEIKPSVKNQHVTQCKQLCQSDPCVYLLVMQVSRFTDDERDILRKVEAAFGRKAKEQTIILFTRGEYLQRKNMSFEDFLQDCVPDLSKIVKQCGGRCVVFENRASRQPHQVTELMQTVNMMLNKQQKQ